MMDDSLGWESMKDENNKKIAFDLSLTDQALFLYVFSFFELLFHIIHRRECLCFLETVWTFYDHF